MKRLIALSLTLLVSVAVGCENPSSNESSDETAEKSTSKSADESTSEDESDNEQADEESTDEMAEGEPDVDPALLKPEEADEQAPDTFKVRFTTTKGKFVGTFHRSWAPNGADRLYNLVKLGFYENVAFFRVIDGFMAQFGIKGIPKVDAAWKTATIEDDPVKKSNKRGYITFAKRKQPNTRTTQLFVNYTDNSESLDKRGFAPVGKVTDGMDVVDELHAGYGEGAPRGDGPSQKQLQQKGNSYLRDQFPKLDWIKSAEVIE